ncbi:MAG: FAD-dependent thymidylate synthase, partial [Candidatus Methanomethylophilaceae archaeon]
WDEHFILFDHALRDLDNYLKEMGINAEERRYFYPQGLKTNIIMTMNGRELLHWLSLRLCTRAQKEHRELAEKILELVKEVSPIIFEGAGPRCVQLGYCPEAMSCGRMPKKGGEDSDAGSEETDGISDRSHTHPRRHLGQVLSYL